ncbi:MAG: zf-HC2 domain-containing protein [Acidobacteria bacterium]|nr:zf-HC2 domain-containing protein [Acidobacteriota bacterium]MBI3470525.1 zf-HC2 domain-containing protein [Candidatus Solibacter usitatus]
MNHEEALKSRWPERYALEELSADEREEFEAHFFDCRRCAEDVRAAFVFRDNAKAVLREDSPPKPDPPGWLDRLIEALRQALRRPAYALSFAAMFLLCGGSLLQYQALKTAPMMVATHVLAPQARGEYRIIEPTGDRVALGPLDIPEEVTPPFSWEMRPAGGTGALMAGTAAAPPKGSSLALSVARSKLAQGRYHLILRGGSQEVTYRFEIKLIP